MLAGRRPNILLSLIRLLDVRIDPSFHFVLDGLAGCFFLHFGKTKPQMAHASSTQIATTQKTTVKVVPEAVRL